MTAFVSNRLGADIQLEPIAGSFRDKAVVGSLRFAASKRAFNFDYDQDRKAALGVIRVLAAHDSRGPHTGYAQGLIVAVQNAVSTPRLTGKNAKRFCPP
jgi:hypothetical protein